MKTLATCLLLSLASLCAAAANASTPPGQALRARLLSPATVSLRVDGKVSGETKLPAGTVLEVVREGEKRVLLKSGFGQHWIDKDKLEIERAQSTPATSPAAAPAPRSTPSKPASPPSTTQSSDPLVDDPLSGLDLPFLSTGDDVSEDSGTDADSSGSRPGRYSYDSTPLVDLPLDDLKSQAAASDHPGEKLGPRDETIIPRMKETKVRAQTSRSLLRTGLVSPSAQEGSACQSRIGVFAQAAPDLTSRSLLRTGLVSPSAQEGSACQSRTGVFARAAPDLTKPARQRIGSKGKTNVWPGRATGAKRRSRSLLRTGLVSLPAQEGSACQSRTGVFAHTTPDLTSTPPSWAFCGTLGP